MGKIVILKVSHSAFGDNSSGGDCGGVRDDGVSCITKKFLLPKENVAKTFKVVPSLFIFNI